MRANSTPCDTQSARGLSWAIPTADLEFSSLRSHESDLRTRSHNYAYRQVVPRNCNLSMLHKSSSGYNPEDMDIV